ncbi:hypothetical protein DERF_001446 [Dermatophagoides farinae]|uniref:Uncharacterized protein n=1 Tax=Dermatophagoides farinae TaxID=6954 RepID=A0A922IAW6_DERFA|nr:hypothetical protein DERF_001446 [Dermatophagoides farinae]
MKHWEILLSLLIIIFSLMIMINGNDDDGEKNINDPYLTIIVHLKKNGFLFTQNDYYNFSRIDRDDIFKFGNVLFDPRMNMFIGTTYQPTMNTEQQLIYDYFKQKCDEIERKYLHGYPNFQQKNNECINDIVRLTIQQRLYQHVRYFQLNDQKKNRQFDKELYRLLTIANSSCMMENDTSKIEWKRKNFENIIISSDRLFVSIAYYFFRIRYDFYQEHRQITSDRRNNLRLKVRNLYTQLGEIIFDLEFYRFNFLLQKQHFNSEIVLHKFFIIFDILIQMKEFYYQNLVD